jgi:predicted ATPase
MLKRIHVKGYKTLKDVEMHLSPFCVLFGPNAAGKSNLLDVLQVLGRIVETPALLTAFDPPYRGTPLESFTFPKNGLKGLLQEDSAKFTIEADIDLSPAIIEGVDRQIREMRQSSSIVKEEADALWERNEATVYTGEIPALPGRDGNIASSRYSTRRRRVLGAAEFKGRDSFL